MVEITLKTRKCNNCGHEAVALEGPNTLCVECPSGRYVARVGEATFEVPEEHVDDFRAKYGNEFLRD